MKDLNTNFFRVSRDPALTEAYAELQKLAGRWQTRNRLAAERAFFAAGGVGGPRAHGAGGNASQCASPRREKP